MPAIRQIQRRDWCPTATTTSVGLQIMLQAVRFTYQMRTTPITLNQPTSTDQTSEAPRELPGFGGPDGTLLREDFNLTSGKH